MRYFAFIFFLFFSLQLSYAELRKTRVVVKDGSPKQVFKQAPELPDELKNSKPVLPDNLPNPVEIREELRLLEQFLQLPEEDLHRIRRTIEKIEAMSPEQKNKMIRKLELLKDVYQN